MCARNRQVSTSVYHLTGQEYISATSVTCGALEVGLQKHSTSEKKKKKKKNLLLGVYLYKYKR